ncbi:rhombosortase [Roseimaritima ulvae]|nr:rhombosortase [Roseimaritima ulvae]
MMILSPLKRYPITIATAAFALLAFASPTLTAWLQLDFAAVADGQWWRIITGHMTHFGGHHLFWDLLMFVVLSAACERQHRRHFGIATLLMMAGISLAIRFFCDDIAVYRGLSGLDTGLFVWFVSDQCRQSLRQCDRLATLLWLAPLIGLVGKLLFEAITGQTLFVDSSTFEPLVEAHLAGAAIGAALSYVRLSSLTNTRQRFEKSPVAELPRVWKSAP